jgi:hypothetical protein
MVKFKILGLNNSIKNRENRRAQSIQDWAQEIGYKQKEKASF